MAGMAGTAAMAGTAVMAGTRRRSRFVAVPALVQLLHLGCMCGNENQMAVMVAHYDHGGGYPSGLLAHGRGRATNCPSP
jgi:hypothetical protein